MQKGSLYAHIDSKADLLWEVARDGAEAFHAALDAVPDDAAGDREDPARAARAPARVAEQLDVATVFIREWRYLEGERRDEFVAERRRYEERSARSSARGASSASCEPISTTRRRRCSRSRPRTGRTPGCARSADTDELADRFFAVLLDGMRGYATPACLGDLRFPRLALGPLPDGRSAVGTQPGLIRHAR